MASPIADVKKTAVLSMDLQNTIVSIYTRTEPDFLTRVSKLLSSARESGIRVMHVLVGFRPGFPEIDLRNPLFGAIKSSPQWQQIFQGDAGAIHADVAPQDGEVVITKHRISAFTGTDLEMILRANEIDTLILLGIATSGVVLSTLLHASDADFKLMVVKDCCADQDLEMHTCLVEKLFPQRAKVLSADEVLKSLQPPSPES